MFQNARLEDEGKIIAIHVPMKFKRRGGRREIILPPGFEEREYKPPTALQIALARAFSWRRMLDTGETESIGDIADNIGIDQSFIAKHLRLMFLAPDIVEAILAGEEPEGLSLGQLYKAIPAAWEEQRELYGFDHNN
ncbi:MAG: hypothetical protein JXR97_14290 [Planctomycetes bacterium]|nr:hypothetical protein [Planctomycetota bacterium]